MGMCILYDQEVELWEMKIVIVKVEWKITMHKISLVTSDFLLER